MTIHLLRLLPFPVLTYLVILAIDTPHITIAKEYRPRPLTPRKNRLLSVVSANGSDYRQVSRMAKPRFTFKSIDLDAWLDDKTFLLGFPKRLIGIAHKRLNGIALTKYEQLYLCRFWKRQQKRLIE